MPYHHLTQEDRVQLAALKRAGHTHTSIASQLGVHYTPPLDESLIGIVRVVAITLRLLDCRQANDDEWQTSVVASCRGTGICKLGLRESSRVVNGHLKRLLDILAVYLIPLSTGGSMKKDQI